MSTERLHAIALISGGKDSFYSLLHCIHHGHGIVALANLLPGGDGDAAPAIELIDPARPPLQGPARGPSPGPSPERDLNSFMYQTVGHDVVPLYAAATGIPLYRGPILGSALRHERDYDAQGSAASGDETESMLPLLQAVKARHPEANALCSGAILSTYQRTRVESMAVRLGLVPLSYLWNFPVLPGPPSMPVADEVQLLRDMAAAGLEARIVKVASAGLDESHLWQRVTSEAGIDSVKAALRRFGAPPGAALGEGGEFETIVLDGPSSLFRKRILVPDDDRAVVPDGAGSVWLSLRRARLEDKPAPAQGHGAVREPGLLDVQFQSILRAVQSAPRDENVEPRLKNPGKPSLVRRSAMSLDGAHELRHWSILADAGVAGRSIRDETVCVVDKIRNLLSSASHDPSQITTSAILLRDMSDFPDVNAEYGKLFTKPNPPSRVIISCGHLMPTGRNIAIYITVPNVHGGGDRNGLHVQARSYWAPANIGPYSQAIDIPVTAEGLATGLRAVYVAGQIPLIPASMSLPPPSDTSLHQQIVLSLQHLWRIGSEMRVQYWTSAVAYFARSPSADAMEKKAKLAGRVWRLIHAPPEDEEEEAERGPDLWDLKYNRGFVPLEYPSVPKSRVALPDWSIFTLRQQSEPESCIPPLYVVEVESLPRGSDVEWHAHMGLSGLDESSAETMILGEVGVEGWRGLHMIVRTARAILVHTVLACVAGEAAKCSAKLEAAMAMAYRGSLRGLVDTESSASRGAPYLGYLDAASMEHPWRHVEEAGAQLPVALIPCRSIWSLQGERLGCVALYRTTMATPR